MRFKGVGDGGRGDKVQISQHTDIPSCSVNGKKRGAFMEMFLESKIRASEDPNTDA
jgi:hypothetical protein